MPPDGTAIPVDGAAIKERIILHIDMNAFYANVEQQANPALRGKPIAVIGAGGRTVIKIASYEARKYGVKTGMAVWEAKRQCPHIMLSTEEKGSHVISPGGRTECAASMFSDRNLVNRLRRRYSKLMSI